MKLAILICAITLMGEGMAMARPATLTFDESLQGHKTLPDYYSSVYGVELDYGFSVVDHTGSVWGAPHSGANVLLSDTSMSYEAIRLTDVRTGFPAYTYSVGGYFSTQPGVVLQMTGVHYGSHDPVASVLIGTPGGSWNNVHVEISSHEGINVVSFVEVTPGALRHFCVDDMTFDLVPEPSSLLALVAGLGGLGGMVWRRRVR